MKSEHINPFIEGTVQTFETMCGIKPVRSGKLQLVNSESTTSNGLLGIIGLSGDLKGAVIMSMEEDLAADIVGRFIGEKVEGIEDLTDGFGEILNIIAGAAAAKLTGNVNLALPTVLLGEKNQLPATKLRPWVIIPMTFPEVGKFDIKVSLEDRN
jgi:chemotaxis protein CheX